MSSLARYIVLAALLLTATLCGCQPKQKSLTPTREVTMQEVEYSDEQLQLGIRDTLNFGRMRQGEVIVKKLKITNRDTKPIVLLRHVTSCGCLKINYERKPIAPGASSVINFEFDSKSLEGWQMKLLELYFADKDTPIKIYIDAEVE